MENTTNTPGTAGKTDTITSIGRDTRADLHGAIDRSAEKAQPTADRLASSAHAAVDKVAEKVQPTADRLASAAHSATDKVAETAGKLGAEFDVRSKQMTEAAKRLTESGRGYVRSSPMTSVLVAVAAGYGLSKLLSSRK